MQPKKSCILKYFEYLALKCKVEDAAVHNQLGNMYLQFIAKSIDNDQNSSLVDDSVILNRNVDGLRKQLCEFLLRSKMYNA